LKVKVPGLHQSSAARPKRSVRTLLCQEWEWETDLHCRDKEGQSSFQCPFWPYCGQGPGSRRGEGQCFAQCLVWLHLKQAMEVCVVVQPVSKLEEVASGQLPRAGPFTGLKPHLSY
jgi:hypothetical protein